ncbi:MAG: ABC transporter permease, partial [Acidimicrobiales bacterium]
VVLAASFVVFVLVATAAGDPLADLRLRPGVSEATIALRRQQLHLDQPVLTRYAGWISAAVRGDLGRSNGGEAVGPLVARRLAVTLRLVLMATVVAALVAVAVGTLGALRPYSAFDQGSTVVSLICFSLPVFWLAALLRDVGIRINQAVGHRVFFVVGEQTPNLGGGWVAVWLDRLGHLLLPSLTLVLFQMATWSRFQRASLREVLDADHVRTARAKGLSPSRVLLRHGLRNALLPVVTLVAIDFAAVLGGTVVVETVFGWSGMGRLLVEALKIKDVNVVQGWLLAAAVLVVAFNLLADVLYGGLDPRIRRG